MQLIYDLTVQPFSVGDLLTNQMATLCMREDEPVDVDILHGVKYSPDFPGFKWLMPVARVNPHLGKVSLCLRVKHQAKSWPHNRSIYTTYDCWRLMTEYFDAHGFIPDLKPLPEMCEWAESFLAEHGRVTVNLRRNMKNTPRNSDQREWRHFFKDNSGTRFVVVGCSHEIDDELRKLKNLTFTDDLDTERVCALIWASDIHLGVASGPAQMRWYQSKPFCIWKETVKPDRVSRMTVVGESKKMPWFTDYQTMLPFAETSQRINKEFERMKNAD